jgi:hypothetical protein
MLYNFHDSPLDLFERMYLNVRLNEELGIRIYSFPMRYQPTDLPDRSHIGEKWNRYYLRSVQIVLQATQGIVSGAPEFYRAAFGSSHQEFEDILARPHHMIFNRRWYERYDGRAEFQEYTASFRKLSPSQRAEVLSYLSARNPSEYGRDIGLLPKPLRKIVQFYVPLPKDRERDIRALQKERLAAEPVPDIRLSDAEIVEDAGLDEEFAEETTMPRKRRRAGEAA